MSIIEKSNWTAIEAQATAKTLETKDVIRVNEKHNISDFEMLDEHIFANRPDIRLMVAPSGWENNSYYDEVLQAIGNMKNLKRLELTIVSKQDLSALGNLTNLEELILEPKVEITVDFLSQLQKLHTLEITNLATYKGDKTGSLKSCAPIAQCKSLKKLYVYNMKKMDFEFAKELSIEDVLLYKPSGYQNEQCLFSSSLKSLTLMNMSNIENLTFLSECKNMEDLTLIKMKKVVSLSGLSPEKLKKLTLTETDGLTDLSILSNAQNLETVIMEYPSKKCDMKEVSSILLAIPTLKEVQCENTWGTKQRDTIYKLFETAGKRDIIRESEYKQASTQQT